MNLLSPSGSIAAAALTVSRMIPIIILRHHSKGKGRRLRYTQKLFIYQRREMVLLTMIIFLATAFTFTLGIHLAKTLGGGELRDQENGPSFARPMEDMPINREELSDPGKDAPRVIEDSLNQDLHEEVTRTGIKLHPSRAVELPSKAKSPNGGATRVDPVAKNPKHAH